MSKTDLIYAGVAGAAVGGVLGPLLFPMAAGMKTASLVTSITASGLLAYAHQSGLIDRVRQEDAEVRESHREVRRQKLISWEMRETKRCEVEDLKEILLMLDDLSPFEQRHFLKELDLLELMPVYQESRMLKMAEAEPTQTIETTASPVQEVSPFDGGQLEWAVDSVISQAVQPAVQTAPIVDDAFEEVDLGKAIAEMMVGGDVPLCVMLACPPRTGKAQPLTSKVLTPTGWREMGDIRIGDLVIAGNGKPTEVIGVYPQGVKEVYQVHFTDGSFTECCDDHLWATQTRWDSSQKPEKRKGFTPKPLSEIRRTLNDGKSHKNHRIPMVGVVQFDPQKVPLDPYVLGALLGDGCFQQSQIGITKGDSNLIRIVGSKLPSDVTLKLRGNASKIDYRIVKTGSKNCRVKSSVQMALDNLGLTGKKSFEKFVPDAYKFNTPDVRLGVLQGLLDTDGSIEQNKKNPESGSCVTFSTTSYQLAEDVRFLVWSFGGRATLASRYTKYTYNGERKTGRKSYRVTISLPSGLEPSQLASKLEIYRPNRRFLPQRIIDRVEPVGKKECQCIAVADPSHLYVTDDFIVTHNTTLMTVTLAWLHKLTSGGAKVKIYNGKENIDPVTGELKDRFLGLVDDPTRYQAIETNEEGKEFAEEFAKVAGRMKQPRRYPEVLILDEYNNIRARVAGFDQMNGIPKNKGYLNQVDVNAGLLITQGTSRRQFLLITSHSAYVKNIGIDRSYQDGIYSIVLGRGGALDGIYKALKGSTAVVQNTTRANQLLAELQQWEQSPTRDHSKVVALTNLIDGNYGLYFAKYVDLSKVQFAPVQQAQPEPAEDPYAIWDEEFEEDNGHQPENDPDWEKTKPQPNSKPSSVPNNSPLAILITHLKQWIATLPNAPTDSQLKAKLLELTGQNFSQDAIAGLKQELGL